MELYVIHEKNKFNISLCDFYTDLKEADNVLKDLHKNFIISVIDTENNCKFVTLEQTYEKHKKANEINLNIYPTFKEYKEKLGQN